MAVIYIMEDFFKIKNLEKKEAVVRHHYTSSRVKLPEKLDPQQIQMLYENLVKFQQTAHRYLNENH